MVTDEIKEKAFKYFEEQSGYTSFDEFLADYEWAIDSLDEYLIEDYKQGMDNLYADTIGRQFKLRKKRHGYCSVSDEKLEEPDEDEPRKKI